MSYKMEQMNEEYANEIISWRYKGILSIYNLANNPETLDELLTKKYYVVIDSSNKIVGFFCIGEAAIVPIGHQYKVYDDDSFIDIGLGMRPDYVGRNKGLSFLEFGLNYFKSNHDINKFRLTVLDFNKRAIHVYHKAGFIIKGYFEAPSKHYFLIMTLEN